MSIKGKHIIRLKKWVKKLEHELSEEKENTKGYEQIAQVHSAYISILLKRLGATKDNAVAFTDSEIKEALKKYEARAIRTENGWGLYCEVKE